MKFVYILGVPRANTTVLCRLLGQRLHGAVYEPALPNNAFPSTGHGRKILGAYERVRRVLGDTEPVTLAIKDHSAMLNDRQRDFVLDHAEHVVFAIREPSLQYRSYVRQLVDEFAAAHRFYALTRFPWETAMYGLHFGMRWPRYRRLSVEQFGIGWLQYKRMTAAGSNLDYWQALARHFAEATRRLPAERITVMDAGLERLAPEAAEAGLDAIVESIAPAHQPEGLPIDVAGYSVIRMGAGWVGEAMSAKALKSFTSPEPVHSPNADFDEWLPNMAAAVYPHYLEMFYQPANRLRRRLEIAAKDLPEDARKPMGHLLEADTAAEAAELARRRGRLAA